jgi:acyl-CoA dehydrogenase
MSGPVVPLGAQERQDIREAIQRICRDFGDEYWRGLDSAQSYPGEFVAALTGSGWLSILIPEEYGGGGMGIAEASVVLEEINRCGGNAAACHAQMYIMGTLLRHGSAEQRVRYLPGIAAGRARLQAFAITESEAGSDTTQIRTAARRDGTDWVLNGQKTFISRVEQSDLMLVLARTGRDQEHRTRGLSVFLIELAAARERMHWDRIPVMFNHHTYTVFFDEVRLPADALVGQEGDGFRYILDGMNAERILVASEAIGDGRFFVDRAVEYASRRITFGRPLASNQGVAFPLAQAYAGIEAADLARWAAAEAFDAGAPCGTQAGVAKLLASQASNQAGRAAVTAIGGMAFTVEMGVERKLREAQLLEVAPVSNNLVLAYLAHNVLKLPRSF